MTATTRYMMLFLDRDHSTTGGISMSRCSPAVLAAALAIMMATNAIAGIVLSPPTKLTYQGVLRTASGTIVPDGDQSLTFQLYQAATGGTAIWTMTQAAVPVSKGLFTVILQAGTPDLSTISFDQPLFLGITVGAGTELAPRIELTSSAYSMISQGVKAAGVTANMIRPGAVTGASIADGTISAADIGTGAVGSAQIADGTITDADVSGSAAIAGAKISPAFNGSITGNRVGAGTSSPGARFHAMNFFGLCRPTCPPVDDYFVGENTSIIIGGGDVDFRVDASGNVTSDGGFTTPAQDYADVLPVSAGARSVQAGDVLAIDPDSPGHVIRSMSARSTLVAGVYSTNPGFIGAGREMDEPSKADPKKVLEFTLADLATLEDKVPVALTGVVPCKVSAENGAIRPGDLLVTAATPGYAMRDEAPKPGTMLGKALEPLRAGTGVIKILITLH